MKDFYVRQLALTDSAVMAMLEAARAEAVRLGTPQCIVIVDASGVELASLRMSGAKFLSLKSALAKARTAASIRAASADIPDAVRLHIAAATNGAVTGLKGGLPIIHEGVCLGGIGVGSGSPDQDHAVASAALRMIGAQAD